MPAGPAEGIDGGGDESPGCCPCLGPEQLKLELVKAQARGTFTSPWCRGCLVPADVAARLPPAAWPPATSVSHPAPAACGKSDFGCTPCSAAASPTNRHLPTDGPPDSGPATTSSPAFLALCLLAELPGQLVVAPKPPAGVPFPASQETLGWGLVSLTSHPGLAVQLRSCEAPLPP